MHEWGEPSPVPPLAANPDPPIKSILRSVLGLITVMILKRVRVFSFTTTNLQHVKVTVGKEVAKSLMVFNLRTIIYPFQSKKYLRT